MSGNNWKPTKLEPHIKIRSGDSPSLHSLSRTEGVPFVKVEDLNNCRKYQVTSREFITNDVSPIPSGSVIFPKRGAAIMNNKIRLTAAPLCLDTNMMALTVTSSELDPEFLFYTLSYAKLYEIADTSTIPQLNNKHINPFVILLPSISEQKKVAATLSTWDRAIELTEKLIAAKQQRKAALTQQLLTGKVRFGTNDPQFRSVSVGEIVEKVATAIEVESTVPYREIGIRSHGKGIFHKEPVFGSEIGEKRVYKVEPGCFTFNVVFAWEQAIAVTTTNEAGFICSHRFPMFRPKAQVVEPKYILAFFMSPKGTEMLELASPGGAGRNRTLGQSAFCSVETLSGGRKEHEVMS
ncbi:restriction endonuclease subunit S [bacterium]|nr:restriction endonuclease subunit S [bacterium]